MEFRYLDKLGQPMSLSVCAEIKMIRDECPDNVCEKLRDLFCSVKPEDIIKFDIHHGPKYTTATVLFKRMIECLEEGNCTDKNHGADHSKWGNDNFDD